MSRRPPHPTEAERLREAREAFDYAFAHGVSMAEARRRMTYARWRARDAAREALQAPMAAQPFHPIDDSDEGLKWFQR